MKCLKIIKEHGLNKKHLKLVGITRVKDEKILIQEHLDHMAEFCDALCVYDDLSTDGTFEIIKNHPKVKVILQTDKSWQPKPVGKVKDPLELWKKNQEMLDVAKKELNPEWFIFLDVDEFLDEDLQKDLPKILASKDYDAICFQMYDFFITEEDKDKPYNGDIRSLRRFAGTEYRNQLFLFRNVWSLFFKEGAHKEPNGFKNNRVSFTDYKIKHYGKAKSIEDYYKKSQHYLKYRPHMRKTKFKFTQPPVHKDKSDLGKLVTWEEIKHNPQIHGPIFYEYHQPRKIKNRYEYWIFHQIELTLRWIKRNLLGKKEAVDFSKPAKIESQFTLGEKEAHILAKKNDKNN